MSRKSRTDPVTKVKVVEKILLGELSISAAAKVIGAGKSTITTWIRLYQFDGLSLLLDQATNKGYSKETKLAVVLDYLNGKESQNQEIAYVIREIHKQHPDMGYRRIRNELEVHHNINVNDKRILRICRNEHIQSSIKWRPKSCTVGSTDPSYVAENLLNRDFHADRLNEKWPTDVSEFKYYKGIEVHKYTSVQFWTCMTEESWPSN